MVSFERDDMSAIYPAKSHRRNDSRRFYERKAESEVDRFEGHIQQFTEGLRDYPLATYRCGNPRMWPHSRVRNGGATYVRRNGGRVA